MKLRVYLIGLSFVLLCACGGPAKVGTQATVTPVAISSVSDGGNGSEKRFTQLLRGYPGQGRSQLRYNAKLNAVARAKARDMGRRSYFGHVDPDGYGPNFHVTRSGYELPLKWTAFPKTNNVESILAGPASPERALAMWMGSKKHRRHLLAESQFYENQTNFGVGYAHVPGSPFKHYWVFVSAPVEGTQEPRW